MKLTDDFEIQTKRTLPMIYMTLGVSMFVVGLLVFTIYLNREKFQITMNKPVQNQTQSTDEVTENSLNDLIGNPNVSAGDLNIWFDDDFSSDEEGDSKLKFEEAQELLDEEEQARFEEEQAQLKEEERLRLEEEKKRLEEELKAQDPSEGGTKTMIVTDAGEEWVLINRNISENTYDESNFSKKSSVMTYYEDGELLTYFGVDISEKTGEVQFDLLKKANVKYVMIQLGSRGYQTGTLIVDSMFQEHIKGATEAGLEVGIYFDSQAITENEIKEEIAFIQEQIGEYEVSYPIVIRMEDVKHDTARTDDLKVAARTNLINVFSEGIKSAGYIPMLYGTKEFFIQSVELTQLKDIDMWLFQESDVPDYPYSFQMWKYDVGKQLSGITGSIANLNVSFIDYTKK